MWNLFSKPLLILFDHSIFLLYIVYLSWSVITHISHQTSRSAVGKGGCLPLPWKGDQGPQNEHHLHPRAQVLHSAIQPRRAETGLAIFV